jgi:hypothetical protein
MSHRRIRRIALALVIAGTVALAPSPAQARENGWRDAGEITRHLRGLLGSFHDALLRLFDRSRGGMDPNGDPTDGGG